MTDYVISIDVGGTRIKAANVNIQGELLSTHISPSNAHKGVDVLFEAIVSLLKKMEGEASGNLLGIALSLSGGVDPDKGVVLLPGKFENLQDYPMVNKLRQLYDVPVYADNDGRLAAYAEKYYGAAKNNKWAVVLTIGTGVGSGVILDGNILIDTNLQFGTQLGHLIMKKSDDRNCLTNNHGTGEILCSATALGLQVRSALQRGVPSSMAEDYFENPFKIDFKRVIEAHEDGDELATQELDVWIDNVSVLLINAVHAYGPEKIILSGGATLASKHFLSKVQDNVNRQVFRYGKAVEIVISEIQDYTVALGGAAMIFKKLNLLENKETILA